MKKVFLGVILSCIIAVQASAQDVQGSKDHPLFSRMTGFIISEYDEEEFGSHTFYDDNDTEHIVEGKKTYFRYECDCESSALKIVRNFANAARKVGGKAYESSGNRVYIYLKQGNAETWAEVFAGDSDYDLTVVEKGEVVQEVTANYILKELNEKGKAVLYILFDSGKSTIKSESVTIIAEIADMMRQAPDLNISVEGHTDSDGEADANQTLSEQRAKAVSEAITKYGIDATRLSSKGFGELTPIADNETPEGKARNRRVELIKK